MHSYGLHTKIWHIKDPCYNFFLHSLAIWYMLLKASENRCAVCVGQFVIVSCLSFAQPLQNSTKSWQSR
jgi:hypothetical protein